MTTLVESKQRFDYFYLSPTTILHQVHELAKIQSIKLSTSTKGQLFETMMDMKQPLGMVIYNWVTETIYWKFQHFHPNKIPVQLLNWVRECSENIDRKTMTRILMIIILRETEEIGLWKMSFAEKLFIWTLLFFWAHHDFFWDGKSVMVEMKQLLWLKKLVMEL